MVLPSFHPGERRFPRLVNRCSVSLISAILDYDQRSLSRERNENNDNLVLTFRYVYFIIVNLLLHEFLSKELKELKMSVKRIITAFLFLEIIVHMFEI